MSVEKETKILLALKKAWEVGYILVFDDIWTIESEEELLNFLKMEERDES